MGEEFLRGAGVPFAIVLAFFSGFVAIVLDAVFGHPIRSRIDRLRASRREERERRDAAFTADVRDAVAWDFEIEALRHEEIRHRVDHLTSLVRLAGSVLSLCLAAGAIQLGARWAWVWLALSAFVTLAEALRAYVGWRLAVVRTRIADAAYVARRERAIGAAPPCDAGA